MDVRIVFMGSPDFAVPVLRRLTEAYPVIGVITQPDRPAGRGQTLASPPVKILAQSLSLPVIQPNRLKEPEAQAQLAAWAPDLIVVAAFGQILRQNVLDLPPHGCVNVHASLLPRWRGASPIQAAIRTGDAQTGVSIMRMDAGVDTGPVLAQRAIPILPEDTAGALSDRLAQLGADLLIETLPAYLNGKIIPQPQDDALATYAPMIQKENGLLDFSRPAVELERQVRAYQPWPGAYTFWADAVLKIQRASAHPADHLSPGQRGIVAGFPAIGTALGCLLLLELQPAGKRPMPGDVFLRGARGW